MLPDEKELKLYGKVNADSTAEAQRTRRMPLGVSTESSVETRETAKPAHWRLKVTFWLDMTLLASICALQALSFTGLVLHEWLGLALVGMVFAHLLFSWSWIASTSRRLLIARSIRTKINYVLNLSLFAAVTVAISSGILISQKAIPSLTGMKAGEMDWGWDWLHVVTSAFIVILSGFHIATNWDWLLAAAEKLLDRVHFDGAFFNRFRRRAL